MKEKKPKKGRDENGVRINNYFETMKNVKQPDNINPETETENTMLLNMIDNIEGITRTGEGGEVITGRVGQPPKYPTVESLINKYKEYLTYIYNNNNRGCNFIPDVEGFCSFARISRETLNTWESTRPPEYSDVIKVIKNDIASYKKQLGLNGKIPPIVLALDFNNNHGYTQKQEITETRRIEIAPAFDPEQLKKKLPKIE